MQKEIQEHPELKEYLLGAITLEEARERVEKRLMLDEEYYEDMLAVEEELTQNYVDGKLSPAEKQAFEQHFLISDERREKVKFARTFRTYVDARKEPERTGAAVKEGFSFARLFSYSPGRWAPAAALILLVILAFSYFWFKDYYANSQALALLNNAYRSGRPLESRITQWNYAPFNRLRGDTEAPVDKQALKRAEGQITDNAENPTAANLLSLARLRLAEKDFDEAIKKLEEAQKLDPNNAEIFNDLGVAYFEKAQLLEDKGQRFEPSVRALEYFEKALTLNPYLLEARFNKARALEAVKFSGAKEAWQEYLKYDSSSGWAREAEKHLQELDAESSGEMSADEHEQAFLNLAQTRNEDEAFRFVSQNRELIRERYLPQKFAMSFVEAQGDRKTEVLDGLKYLGEIEKKHNNDLFASDLADFYSGLSPEKIEMIKKAQLAMREGYRLCLEEDDYKQALLKFKEAGDFFLQAGDVIEANTISKHFIAYCLYSDDRRQEAYTLLKEIDAFTGQKHYEWFSLMNSYWLIGAQDSLGYMLFAETREHYETALKKARSSGDLLMTQQFLSNLITKTSLVRQDKEKFNYLGELLDISAMPGVSARQRSRNYSKAVRVLAGNGLPAFSREAVHESVTSAEVMSDPLFLIDSQKNAASVAMQVGNFPEAENWLSKAQQKAESLTVETQKNDELTRIFLKRGDLESKRKNYQKAVEYYEESRKLLEKTDIPLLPYEVGKSKLLAEAALGDDDQVEKDIPVILQMAEDYRKEIDREDDRNKFFNFEQEVYDVAIEHQLKKNDFEQAFNFAEISSSRSLLDLLAKKANTPSPEPVKPLTASEIREQMPAGAQILQYAVLKDKVVIWIISKEDFKTVFSEIKAGDLKEKVKTYFSLIGSKNPEQQGQIENISRELYSVLLAPALPYLNKERDVCIIPNKILFNLSFAPLLSAEGKYFLEEFSFFYSTSANVFVRSTEEAGKRNSAGEEHLLSVGNPAFDRKKLLSLKDLPDSGKEAEQIASNYFQPTVLVGKDATKSAFRQALESADVISYAGHYIVSPDTPLSSELVMAKSSDNDADNFFSNAELKNESLPRTKLVVLAACQTGVEGYYNGEGLIGLSRTFLSLGVPLVVASQWPVDSEATAKLMKKFHYYRKHENLSSNHALRRAQLEMLDSPNGEFRAPFYWAAFAAFGGYAEF
jgi:CHAT domain-containing protein/cytochrome c-type biogenesis protein CcmH/NrfG